MDSPLVPRPGILQIAPYVGGEARLSGHNRVVRIASNENPLGCSEKARAAYIELAGELHRYPSGGHDALRLAIAEAYGLPRERIVCGAGSDELLSLLGRAYAGPGDEVLFTEHGFAMYPIIAQSVGARPVKVAERDLHADVDLILAAVTPRTRIVFLANPNNPTGTYLPAHEVDRLRAGLPAQVLLVLDAAYAEYVTAADYRDGAALVAAHQNVVMTRTFSKIHGLAALRLGWAFCPPAIADVLNRIRGPFNVTAPALEAGCAAVRDEEHLRRSVEHNSVWRTWLTAELRKLGLDVPESYGNFILVRFHHARGRSADAALEHLNRAGIIPRRMAGYGLPDALRLTVGREDENLAVVQALTDFLGS